MQEESTGQMEQSESAARIRALEAENRALRERLEKATKALVQIRDESGRTVAVSPEQIARWCLEKIGEPEALRALDGEGE